MLIALRDYLKTTKRASLKDVALHFDIPEGAAQDMLQYWMNKGRVTIQDDEGPSCARQACGGCHHHCCGATSSVNFVYYWVD